MGWVYVTVPDVLEAEKKLNEAITIVKRKGNNILQKMGKNEKRKVYITLPVLIVSANSPDEKLASMSPRMPVS